MTNNQIAYLSLVENKRNNATVNKETNRHNLRGENLARKTFKEQVRHNLITEGNQLIGYQTDLKRANIAAQATKYGADTSAAASMYGADKAAEATRYAADRNKEAQGYAADRNAQTNLTMKYIDKQIQAAHDKTNKTINNDSINAATKKQLLQNASNQFIKNIDKEMKKYEIDKKTQVEYDKIKKDIAQSIIKGAFDNLDKLWNQLSTLLFKAKLNFATN